MPAQSLVRKRRRWHDYLVRTSAGSWAILCVIYLFHERAAALMNIGSNVYSTPKSRLDLSLSPYVTSVSGYDQGMMRKSDGSLRAMNIQAFEEHETKEMEWLVKTTQECLSLSHIRDGDTTSLSRSQCRRIHNLMKAWGSRRTQGAPYVVDQLFDQLQKNAPHNITTQSFNLRLEAWAASKDAQSIAKCTAILKALKSHDYLQPNVHSYNACIKAWIRSGEQGLEKVENLIDELHREYNQTADIMLAPNRRTLNLLLYGLAHSNNSSMAAIRALEVFDYFQTNKEPFCQPNCNTFHQVIQCLARDSHSNGFENRLEETFQTCLALSKEREIEFSADTFNVYMSGWLKSSTPVGLERIQAALETMEHLYEDGGTRAKPNCVTMNTVLAAYVKFAGKDSVDHILAIRKRLELTYSITPDTTTFNTLIDAHAKSRRAVADISSLSLLQIMERHLIKKKGRAKPDAYTYCAVIDCLAKNKLRTAGAQSELILRRMVELHHSHGGVKPSIAVYNSVFNAMATSSPVNLTSVKCLLFEMKESKDEALPPKPSIVTYNSALKAALKSGSVHGAEWADEVLRMLETKASPGNPLKPDSFSYTTVIAAYGRSYHRDKAAKATELVERALRLYHEGCFDGYPNVSIFNAACNACCFVDGDEDEKVRAFSTMSAISTLLANYTAPDQTTFGTLLRACSQLLPRGQSRQQAIVRQIFRKACDEGLCGDFVMKQMKFASTPETYKDLFGFDVGSLVGLGDIPDRWRRNVNNARSFQR